MSVFQDYMKYRAQSNPEFQRLWEGSILPRKIAKPLIGIRLELGMKPQQFAEHLSVSHSFLSRMENGEQKLMINTLQQLVRRVGLTLKEPPTF
jgi:DNA-binding transcriptional regulator YiaG